MAINAYSIEVAAALMDGSTVQLPSPGVAQTGSLLEAYGGLPMRVAAGATDVNYKLGALTQAQWLAVYGAEGISFKLQLGGTSIRANPFAFIADTDADTNISEIWLSNSSAAERSVTILAAE